MRFLVQQRRLAGHGRPECQDQLTFLRSGGGFLLAVADGVGGVSGGLEAASAVMNAADAAAAAGAPMQRGFGLQEQLFELDHALNATPDVGLTTAILIGSDGARLHGASVGDSRALLVSAHGWTDLTMHQRRSPKLGDGTATPVAFAAGWGSETLLVGTDGLFGVLPDETIATLARLPDIAEAAEQLVAAARRRSIQDDLGLILLRKG